MDRSIELTRDALAVARAYMDLPGIERQKFADAIAQRVAAWRIAGMMGQPFPDPWSIVVTVAQDSRV